MIGWWAGGSLTRKPKFKIIHQDESIDCKTMSIQLNNRKHFLAYYGATVFSYVL